MKSIFRHKSKEKIKSETKLKFVEPEDPSPRGWQIKAKAMQADETLEKERPSVKLVEDPAGKFLADGLIGALCVFGRVKKELSLVSFTFAFTKLPSKARTSAVDHDTGIKLRLDGRPWTCHTCAAVLFEAK